MTLVEFARHVNGPAAAEAAPTHGTGGISSDARETLLSADALAFAAYVRRVQAAAMKDKTYRTTPIGGEAGRFLRSLRWGNASESTLLSYESTLQKLALDFADKEWAELARDDYLTFLDERWGEAAPGTRRQRLACVKSFCEWGTGEGRIPENPIAKEKPPKLTDVNRQAYSPDVIATLINEQELLRDQIGCQLLGRNGLRRNELRLMQIGDFHLDRGTMTIHGKGRRIVEAPLGFSRLKRDLAVYLVGRHPDEYLIYPKADEMRPMSLVGLHYWFKRCLKAAGLTEQMMMHEMRHSAADAVHRGTKDLVRAQQLLRHKNVGTTQAYLHPVLDDLADALAALEQSWEGEDFTK